MNFMARDPAEWRSFMTDDERAELARAERARDIAAEQLRDLTATLKNRCMKRRDRSKPKD